VLCCSDEENRIHELSCEVDQLQEVVQKQREELRILDHDVSQKTAELEVVSIIFLIPYHGHDCKKNWWLWAPTFTTGVFIEVHVQIACGRHFCLFAGGGLIEIHRFFVNDVFSIFVQLVFKYRQNSTHSMPLYSHSVKHQQ